MRVAIVGLGSIGMGLDIDQPSADVIASHCRAITRHTSFTLAAGVDPDPVKRRQFEARFGRTAYDSAAAMMKESHPELVIVATPTSSHREVCEDVLSGPSPLAVLLEKPVSLCVGDDQFISDLEEKSGSLVLVNYLRRADTSYRDIVKLFREGRLTGPFEGICWYSKGLYNSASHFLDLLFGWFGPLEMEGKDHRVRERRGNDLDVEFVVSNQTARVRFIPLDDQNFSHHSLDVMARNGRLSYDRGGEDINVAFVEKDSLFPSYNRLGSRLQKIPGSSTDLMLRVYDDVLDHIEGRKGSLPTLAEALRVNVLLHSISESVSGE